MQDYNYIYAGCPEITIELSCCKYPKANELPTFWAYNRKSLLAYLRQANRGVRGVIRDVSGNIVPSAVLRIKGRKFTFRSTKRGEYWRVLLPGDYVLEIWGTGYIPTERQFTVVEGKPTLLNVFLKPDVPYMERQVVASSANTGHNYSTKNKSLLYSLFVYMTYVFSFLI